MTETNQLGDRRLSAALKLLGCLVVYLSFLACVDYLAESHQISVFAAVRTVLLVSGIALMVSLLLIFKPYRK